MWLRRLNEVNLMSSGQPEDADITKREQRQRHRRRVSAGMGVFVACIGLMSFFRVAGNPRFETIHTLDVIGLMTAGAGIAAGLVLLIQFFCLPGPRSEDKKN
jgi:hypothetical protein